MRARFLILPLLLAATALAAGCAGGAAATQKLDQQIKQGTDMQLDDMTKARDMSVESQISSGINSDPGLANIKDKITVTVSHNVVTISGRVKSEAQKSRIEEIVKNAVATASVKEYDLKDLVIDDTIEELPFDWD